MKTQTAVLFGVVFGVVAGFVGFTGVDVLTSDIQSASTKATGLIMGHVELVAMDNEGNIKQYVQTDNIVTDVGEACALKRIFDESATGSSDCEGNVTSGGFNIISLGSGGSPSFVETSIQLANETDRTSLFRQTGTTTITDDSGDQGGADANITKTFNNGGSSISINESGLFNSTATATGGLFAAQAFTAIPLSNGDSLAVTWTVTLDGDGA